jgi:hypothetical protein
LKCEGKRKKEGRAEEGQGEVRIIIILYRRRVVLVECHEVWGNEGILERNSRTTPYEVMEWNEVDATGR